jgi:protocatechuate 3,4-dioxygenase beta subunit
MSLERKHTLTRRQTLGAAGLAGAGVLLSAGRRLPLLDGGGATAASAACTLTPEEEEGPYYVSLERVRRNIVGGRSGVPLYLTITVVNSNTCAVVKNAAVDIWHCDALGVYSDESAEGTSGQTWLRGVQLTNAHGQAKFRTIYPGHYTGRATHIHVKVHIGGTRSGSKYSGGHVSHTGQLFFSDAASGQVYKLAPYRQDTNARTLHAADRVWTQEHGASSVMALHRRGSSLAKQGLRGAITLGVDPSATPSAV